MQRLVGIDLGTGSVKVVVTDPAGRVLASAARRYPVLVPRPGWAEQDPARWWEATCAAVAEALAGVAPAAVRGVGLSGQMHGLVALDAGGEPVRPAIIWPDTRSIAEVAAVRERLGAGQVFARTGAPASTGFLAASLAWLRRAEPAAFAGTHRVLLPKDYLRLRLTGRAGTDPSDASGTLLLDLPERRWSPELLAAWELPERLLPAVTGSAEVAGRVTATAAAATGLPAGTPVVTGAGDLAAAAVGLGMTGPGTAAVLVGTGGQLVTCLDRPLVDPRRRVQTFAHALPGRWLLLGALLAAGQSLEWLAGVLGAGRDGVPELVAAAARVPAGADGLLFLPYLNGVRSPHVDPSARGCFAGLGLGHGPPQLARAVLEGVGYALRECLDAFTALGVRPAALIAAGGGARLPGWRQILADVLGRELRLAPAGDHSALGAARLAALGLGLATDPAPAPPPGPAAGPVVAPDPGRRAVYQAGYARYRSLYPALRDALPAGVPLATEDTAGAG